MPALVAAIKKQADASLGKITEKMPTTTGAIAEARKTVDDVVNALETGNRAQMAKLVGKAQTSERAHRVSLTARTWGGWYRCNL